MNRSSTPVVEKMGSNNCRHHRAHRTCSWWLPVFWAPVAHAWRPAQGSKLWQRSIQKGYFLSHMEQCSIDSATLFSPDLLKSIISNRLLDKNNGVSLKMAFFSKIQRCLSSRGMEVSHLVVSFLLLASWTISICLLTLWGISMGSWHVTLRILLKSKSAFSNIHLQQRRPFQIIQILHTI